MRIIAIVICALGFSLGEARADILELLKTHKIVIGDGCNDKGAKPCTPPPMNPQSEYRLAKDIIFAVGLVGKGGFIYPLNREEDIREHPLMAGFFQRNTFKYFYLKTQATVAGNTLILGNKSAYGDPGDQIHSVTDSRIEVSGTNCTMTSDSRSKAKSGFQSNNKWRYVCQVVPLETGAAAAEGPKWRTLRFTNINYPDPSTKKVEKEDYSFSLLNDRLYFTIDGCGDSDKVSVEFDWRGGSLQGNHECQSGTGRMVSQKKLSYASALKIDGNRRELTATGENNQRGFAASKMSFDYDVRFVLDGDKCRVEKFHKKLTYHTYGGSPVIYSADAQSACYLD